MADYEQNSGKRPHLTNDQRVPRCYKEVEKVLQAVKSCQGNIKTVMYKTRLRGAAFKKVYALAVNVLKYRTVLEKILEETELLKKETIRKEMAGIMIHEMIFGKGLPGESKPVLTMMRYQDDIFKVYESLKDVNASVTGLYTLPKYVRINALKTSMSTILKDLEAYEYQQIFYEDGTSLDEFLDLAKNLETGSFLIDYHFKDLLVFANKENLTTWPLYQKGHVFIQDKSSYLPVHALNPKPDSSVIDACAAPGMKTIHIASLMQNSGKIYAFEKDKERFEILKNMLNSADVKICSSGCQDFYLVDRDNPKYSSVECILVDPSCSGSGMVNRMDEVTDTEDSKNKMRLQKLAGFQILILKHALSFPSVKRVVYSTCSITEEENEFVVHQVLNHYKRIFKLAPVMPDWPIRGYDHFEFGNLCLRAFPEKSLTNGFFVAMFERLDCGEKQQSYRNSFADSRSARKDKYNKRRIKSELQEHNHHDGNCSQEQDSEFREETNPYSENIYSDKYVSSKSNSRKNELKPEFQEASQYSENTSLYHDSTTEYMSTERNTEYPSCVTENDDILNTSSYEQNWDGKEKAMKKRHKKKRNHEDDVEFLNETSECYPEPYSSEPIAVSGSNTKKRKKKHQSHNVESVDESAENCEAAKVKNKKSKRVRVEDKEVEDQPVEMDEFLDETSKFYPEPVPVSDTDTKKHKKKKKHSHDVDFIDESTKNGEVTRVKHKKSKRVKDDKEIEDQPVEIDETRHSESKKNRKKAKHSHHLNNEESNEPDIELCSEITEVQEIQKKKHKKKCKDKKHKGD